MRRKSDGQSVGSFFCFPALKYVFEHVPSQTHEKSRNDPRRTSFSKEQLLAVGGLSPRILQPVVFFSIFHSSRLFLAFPIDNSYRNRRQKPIKIRRHPLTKHDELSVGSSSRTHRRGTTKKLSGSRQRHRHTSHFLYLFPFYQQHWCLGAPPLIEALSQQKRERDVTIRLSDLTRLFGMRLGKGKYGWFSNGSNKLGFSFQQYVGAVVRNKNSCSSFDLNDERTHHHVIAQHRENERHDAVDSDTGFYSLPIPNMEEMARVRCVCSCSACSCGRRSCHCRCFCFFCCRCSCHRRDACCCCCCCPCGCWCR